MNGTSSRVHSPSHRDNPAVVFLKYSFLMSLIVSLPSFPSLRPSASLILPFFYFFFWTPNDDSTLIAHLKLLLFLRFQDTIVFQFGLFFFFLFNSFFFFLKGLCWCSFQLFFWLSPFTWIGSAGPVSARCQDPDYQSRYVTSMGFVQAAPPCEFSLCVAAPWFFPRLILFAVKLRESTVSGRL